LKAAGITAANLDAEDGSFHQDMTGVEHHGFRREWFTEQFQSSKTPHSNPHEKTVATGSHS
jgi:hypothetical protein